MSAAIERVQNNMRTALEHLAWPADPGEKLKVTHDKIHSALKGRLSHRQIRALWAREWKHVPAHIYLFVLERAEAHEQQLDAKIKAARKRQAEVWALIHHGSDPTFHRGQPGLDGGETD